MNNLPAEKPKSQAPAIFEAPDYISHGQEGLLDIRPQDIMLPRLVLLQALSPSVVEGTSPRHVAGAVMNSLTGDIWIPRDEEVSFVPVLHYCQWIKWGDREENEGILEMSLDPASELAMSAQKMERRMLKSGKTIIDATEYHNFVCVFPSIGAEKMVVLSCCRTNHKRGRLLIGLAKYRGNYPLFAGKYALSTKLEQNRRGEKYFVYNIQNDGWCPKEIYNSVQALYTGLKEARSVQMDMSGEQDEAAEDVAEKDF